MPFSNIISIFLTIHQVKPPLSENKTAQGQKSEGTSMPKQEERPQKTSNIISRLYIFILF
jgi:hypothetical protein